MTGTGRTTVEDRLAGGWERFEEPLRDLPPLLAEPARTFLRTGDAGPLDTLTQAAAATRQSPQAHQLRGFVDLGRFMHPPDAWDEFDRRAVRVMHAAGQIPEGMQRWLVWAFREAAMPEGVAGRTLAALRSMGVPDAAIDQGLAALAPGTLVRDDALTEFGRMLLDLPPRRLSAALAVPVADDQALCRLFLRHAPDRAEAVVGAVEKRHGPYAWLCTAVCEAGGPSFLPLAERLFEALGDDFNRFEAGKALAGVEPARHVETARRAAARILAEGNPRPIDWLLDTLGPEGAPELLEYFRDDGRQYDARTVQIDYAAEKYAAQAAPLLLAALESRVAAVHAAALRHLVAFNDSSVEPQVAAAIERGLSEQPRVAAKFAVLAGRSKLPQFRERLWEMLGHKSKLLREAAAEGLAAGDPGALDRAAGLLAETSKDVRVGAVRVLRELKTAEACDCLLHWLPREKDPEVRNEVTAALREAGTDLATIFAGLAPVSLDELRERAKAVKGMPAKWLDEGELLGGDPTGAKGPLLADGTPLGPDLVRYLLRQQSKQADPIPDAEVAGLYATTDRRTSGDFAHRLLTAFLESGRGKADAWALVVAGMLGDNRVVTTLAAQVRKWAESFDQKLGEWGIEALALNGSDAALMAVDSIARRFRDSTRRKHAVIGEAAQDAIEKAAKRMGVSMDDLGDRIVPSFGFEPGRPRRIEAGPKVIEATVGLDFKLVMKDAATGKKAAIIPKAAGPEVQAEFKGLGKLLQEVAKVQSARLEGLMVRQHRWAGARWKELFLRHPLLFPFAVRLVWAVYDESGKPAATFRALPDRSLTDSTDDPVDPPADDSPVGIVHPLELSAGQAEAWRTHLGDYEIEPPFEQIDRRVVTVPPGLGAATHYDGVKGATLNGFSFRGKAEKSGWSRGQTGGGVTYSYQKRFPALGVDAYVVLDGLAAWDPSATVTLREAFFLPAGAREDRVEAARMRLGDVPVMAFSEAAGDLLRISGRGEGAGEASGEASEGEDQS